MNRIKEKNMKEYKLQNKEYIFPYHHIPHMHIWKGIEYPCMEKLLYWGFEYLGYNTYIANLVLKKKPQTVLDVGCGDGKFLQIIKKKIKKNLRMELHGIDISEEAICFANLLNGDSGILYEEKDISDITGEYYNVVTCVETLEHIPDDIVSNMILHIHRCLKHGGYAIFSVPTTNRPKEDKHFRHYTIELLMEEIKESGADFEVESIDYIWKKDAMRKYLFWTANGFMYIRFRLLDRLLWKKALMAKSGTGAHLVVVLRKR